MKTLSEVTSKEDIQALELNGVEIEFTPEECDISPSDSFELEEDIKRIVESYNSGNMAAWFTAKVTVKYRGLEADDYLGGCSYRSFKEFTDGVNDYYGDMINQCIRQINNYISSNNKEIQKNWNLRRAKNLVSSYGYMIISKSAII